MDERPQVGEDPLSYVVRVAQAKARATRRGEGEVVLAADTEVVLDGEVLGKPRDADHAGGLTSRLVVTEVRFAPLSEAAIRAYVVSGEPFGKAGAYGIQGRAAAFVERLDGSWTNVVGLPLVEALAMLRAAGVGVP